MESNEPKEQAFTTFLFIITVYHGVKPATSCDVSRQVVTLFALSAMRWTRLLYDETGLRADSLKTLLYMMKHFMITVSFAGVQKAHLQFLRLGLMGLPEHFIEYTIKICYQSIHTFIKILNFKNFVGLLTLHFSQALKVVCPGK